MLALTLLFGRVRGMRVFLRIVCGVFLAGLVLPCRAKTNASAATTPSAKEIMAFAELLETADYSRANVRTADATKNVVIAMMQQLDPQRMIFEAGDVAELCRSADETGGVYQMVRHQGNVSTGAEIYDLYLKRWEQRVRLVQKLLAGALSVSGNYDPTSKASRWPRAP